MRLDAAWLQGAPAVQLCKLAGDAAGVAELPGLGLLLLGRRLGVAHLLLGCLVVLLYRRSVELLLLGLRLSWHRRGAEPCHSRGIERSKQVARVSTWLLQGGLALRLVPARLLGRPSPAGARRSAGAQGRRLRLYRLHLPLAVAGASGGVSHEVCCPGGQARAAGGAVNLQPSAPDPCRQPQAICPLRWLAAAC